MIELKGKNPDIDGLNFCLKAMSKDRTDVRTHMTHLLIKKGFMVVADGSRCHRYRTVNKYQSGIYRVFKVSRYNIALVRTKKPLSDFPKTAFLFKTKKPYASINALFDTHDYSAGVAQVIRNLPEERCVNLEYLKALGDWFDVKIPQGGDDPILFGFGRKSAAIMPMRA